MLQFITRPRPGRDAVAQALEAIEGGCRWIELDMPGATDEEVRRAAEQLTPRCRETDCFLVIRGHVDVVNELKVSGVMLGQGDAPASAVREQLGPHAIIGVEARNADDVLNQRRADIDYAVVGPWGEVPDADYAHIVSGVRDSGCATPIVATGPIGVDDIPALMSTGVSGVAIGAPIADAPDIAHAVASYLTALEATL